MGGLVASAIGLVGDGNGEIVIAVGQALPGVGTGDGNGVPGGSLVSATGRLVGEGSGLGDRGVMQVAALIEQGDMHGFGTIGLPG